MNSFDLLLSKKRVVLSFYWNMINVKDIWVLSFTVLTYIYFTSNDSREKDNSKFKDKCLNLHEGSVLRWGTNIQAIYSIKRILLWISR